MMTDALSSSGSPAILIASLASWLLLVNLLTFVAFTVDARRVAAGEMRMPAFQLLLLSLLGGWPAAMVAQFAFGSASRQRPFGLLLTLSILPVLGLAGFGMAQDLGLVEMASNAMASVMPAAAAEDGSETAAPAPKPTLHQMGQNAAPKASSVTAKADLPKRIGPASKTSAWQSR